MTKPRGIVFMGTPDFACPTLRALVESGETILAVATQPDRPQGRGRRMAASPVKTLALELDLPVWQPETLRGPEALAHLETLGPEAIVVAAYGLILPPAVLDLPPLGCLNVHGSLLPAYRGPAPIQWAVLNGEIETGVTIMRMAAGVDTGPILRSRSTNIQDTDTAGGLHDRLAALGANLLVEALAGLRAGTIVPEAQDESRASHAPMLKKTDGLMDWTLPAEVLSRRVRGLDPWPGAYTRLDGRMLKIFGPKVGSDQGGPGEILGLGSGGLIVAAGQGSLTIAELQLAGQRRLAAADFWRGQRLSPGLVLG